MVKRKSGYVCKLLKGNKAVRCLDKKGNLIGLYVPKCVRKTKRR